CLVEIAGSKTNFKFLRNFMINFKIRNVAIEPRLDQNTFFFICCQTKIERCVLVAAAYENIMVLKTGISSKHLFLPIDSRDIFIITQSVPRSPIGLRKACAVSRTGTTSFILPNNKIIRIQYAHSFWQL